ncbi:MAG: hypothetical protein QOF44_956 [Streptomyces sp.]|nr:hypothetical protein [Streptomyces sp.]
MIVTPRADVGRCCAFLGGEWRPKTVNYRKGHGPFEAFIGDWSGDIKSGSIQKARPLPEPEEMPAEFNGIARIRGCAC